MAEIIYLRTRSASSLGEHTKNSFKSYTKANTRKPSKSLFSELLRQETEF